MGLLAMGVVRQTPGLREEDNLSHPKAQGPPAPGLHSHKESREAPNQGFRPEPQPLAPPTIQARGLANRNRPKRRPNGQGRQRGQGRKLREGPQRAKPIIIHASHIRPKPKGLPSGLSRG